MSDHDEFGTPEFVAPEMYDGVYNGLGDIYAFRLCLLEMVTREYPYKECRSPAHIYERVRNGVMPASLEKVKDPQVKQFTEKCLVPAPRRLSAIELLRDPFLAADDPQRDGRSIKVSPRSCSSSTLKCQRSTKNNDLTLTAKRNIDSSNTIALTLSVADPHGRRGKKKIEFDFYIDLDTAVSIAGEMVDQELGLATEDVSPVAELIDNSVMKLVPKWKPTSSGAYSSVTNASSDATKSAKSTKSTTSSSICSLQSELSPMDKYQYDQQKTEVDLINAQYQQRFVELVEMKDEAIRSAKMKLVDLV